MTIFSPARSHDQINKSDSTLLAELPDGRVAPLQADSAGRLSALVSGTTPRVVASFVRPANATQYAAGDIIANSGTAASVVPLVFNVGRSSGRISGCRVVLEAASGTIVLPAFDLLIFRPEAGIPFADGGYPADNAVLTLSGAALRNLVGIFSFAATTWENSTGGSAAAGSVAYQAAGLKLLNASSRAFAPFNIEATSQTVLLGLIRAQSAWNPGNVAQDISVALDIDCD